MLISPILNCFPDFSTLIQAKVISPPFLLEPGEILILRCGERQRLVQKCRIPFSSHNWTVSYSVFLLPSPQPMYLCVSQPAAPVCPLACEGSQPAAPLPPDPGTFWQSRRRVWCHSSLAGHSLPCRHPQWFPPDRKGHVSLSGRH